MTETKPTRTARWGRIFPEIQWTEEQLAQWEAERKEFKERCLPIFDKVKAELIETHYNWFVAVEPDSGEYFVDQDSSVASCPAWDKQQYSQRLPALVMTNRRKEDGIVDIDRSTYVAGCLVTRCACNLSRDKNSANSTSPSASNRSVWVNSSPASWRSSKN